MIKFFCLLERQITWVAHILQLEFLIRMGSLNQNFRSIQIFFSENESLNWMGKFILWLGKIKNDLFWKHKILKKLANLIIKIRNDGDSRAMARKFSWVMEQKKSLFLMKILIKFQKFLSLKIAKKSTKSTNLNILMERFLRIFGLRMMLSKLTQILEKCSRDGILISSNIRNFKKIHKPKKWMALPLTRQKIRSFSLEKCGKISIFLMQIFSNK